VRDHEHQRTGLSAFAWYAGPDGSGTFLAFFPPSLRFGAVWRTHFSFRVVDVRAAAEHTLAPPFQPCVLPTQPAPFFRAVIENPATIARACSGAWRRSPRTIVVQHGSVAHARPSGRPVRGVRRFKPSTPAPILCPLLANTPRWGGICCSCVGPLAHFARVLASTLTYWPVFGTPPATPGPHRERL